MRRCTFIKMFCLLSTSIALSKTIYERKGYRSTSDSQYNEDQDEPKRLKLEASK